MRPSAADSSTLRIAGELQRPPNQGRCHQLSTALIQTRIEGWLMSHRQLGEMRHRVAVAVKAEEGQLWIWRT